MHISPLLKNSLQCNQHTLFQIRKSALDKYCHPVHKPHSNFTNCPRVFLSPFLPRILSRNNKCLIPLHALQFSFVSCFPWFSRLQALYSIDASHPIYPHGQTQVMCSWQDCCRNDAVLFSVCYLRRHLLSSRCWYPTFTIFPLIILCGEVFRDYANSFFMIKPLLTSFSNF